MFFNKKLLNIFKKTKTTTDEFTYPCSYINNQLDLKENKSTIIWTNPNPSLIFAGQKVEFSGTYEYYDVISWVDGVTYEVTRVYPGKRTIMQILEGGFIRTRYATATSNSITFTGGKFYASYSSGTDNDSQVIPFCIIGYTN